jgi:hypothetical protein
VEGFADLRTALDSAGIRFAVGGSWASTAFGEPRSTNDVDIVADIHPENLDRFLAALPPDFYVDRDSALDALRRGRPFNVIHMGSALKFDIFPAQAFPIGLEEIDRAIPLPNSGLSESPVPLVSAEDILLAKLHWYKAGGAVSEVQWRDVRSILRNRAADLDYTYLQQAAAKLGVSDLLDRLLHER